MSLCTLEIWVLYIQAANEVQLPTRKRINAETIIHTDLKTRLRNIANSSSADIAVDAGVKVRVFAAE